MSSSPNPRRPHYNAAESIYADETADPYKRPAFSASDRLRRLTWNLCWIVLFRPSPRPFHAWRSALLRLFGAQLGPECHIYPGAKIWAPWNLRAADSVAIADQAEIYNAAPMTFGSHAIVSQGCVPLRRHSRLRSRRSSPCLPTPRRYRRLRLDLCSRHRLTLASTSARGCRPRSRFHRHAITRTMERLRRCPRSPYQGSCQASVHTADVEKPSIIEGSLPAIPQLRTQLREQISRMNRLS